MPFVCGFLDGLAARVFAPFQYKLENVDQVRLLRPNGCQQVGGWYPVSFAPQFSTKSWITDTLIMV